MKRASEMRIDQLVGKKVRTLTDFESIPTGTLGTVVSRYGDYVHAGVMVQWDPPHNVKDGFGRDAKFDETQWLEVVEDGETSTT